MLYESYLLSDFSPKLKKYGSSAVIIAYVQDKLEKVAVNDRPAVIICPGGKYQSTTKRNGEPVAVRFLAAGYQVFVLHYSCSPAQYPQQLIELAATVLLLRKKTGLWNINPEKIILCGFSAGGHLCANLANFWQKKSLVDFLDCKNGEIEPNACVLCYPVISSGSFGHKETFKNLLGTDYEKLISEVSLENSVTKKNPPTFLWHSASDKIVPAVNSLLYAQSLIQKNIFFELHIYPEGAHGSSLCEKTSASIEVPEQANAHTALWFSAALGWLELVFNR